jgi:nucleotide-binding universal stress UspA family protein
MRVLGCLDGANIEQVSKAISSLLNTADLTIGLLYVTDIGPREDMERQRERFFRPHPPPPPRQEQMRQAESMAAQDVLEEGVRHLSGAAKLQRAGRPEREIVNCATEWNADLIVICSRSPSRGGPPLGPKSIGHVARFVLDHAPCPVLLVRPVSRNNFPIPG